MVYTHVTKSVSIWKALLFGILPHGLFELTAVFLCMALGLYIGTNWLRRHKQYTFKKLFRYTIISYCSLVLPLMILAALIETYITPQLSCLM